MTNDSIHVFPPPAVVDIPITGSALRFAVRRVYCVGRNYEEHAKEMGFTGREPPFFFMKINGIFKITNRIEIPK